MAEIATILGRQIELEGVISFARFMETALYCPGIGYYERSGAVLGSRGDFYTSVNVGSLFGRLLALQFSNWFECQSADVVRLVEAGAHDGQLAFDILKWMRAERPALYERLDYWFLEPSKCRRQWQTQKLDSFSGHVHWAASWNDLPPGGVSGAIFCNELLDALPVHRLFWDARSLCWMELGVGVENNEFEWRPMRVPAKDWALELQNAGFEFPRELLAVLPHGFIIDFSSQAGQWWREAAQALSTGRLVTLDYGLTAEQLLAPQRSGGTLRAYSKHHLNSDVLANPGEQDITAHVNFSQLRVAGEKAGLSTEEDISQTQFLTRIAAVEWEQKRPLPAEVRQFQALTHPEYLGRAFRVLVQTRSATLPPE